MKNFTSFYCAYYYYSYENYYEKKLFLKTLDVVKFCFDSNMFKILLFDSILLRTFTTSIAWSIMIDQDVNILIEFYKFENLSKVYGNF